MSLNVRQVSVQFIAQTWLLVEKYIDSAVKFSDDYSAEQIKVYLSSGQWILLVIVDDNQKIHGALTVAFSNDANFRTAIITCLGGKGVVTNDLFNQVKNIAASFGATRIQAYARDSAARLYEKVGLAKKATLMEIKL